MTAVSAFKQAKFSKTLSRFDFWSSGSCTLDWVIMPSLYVLGHMTQAGFATAGYLNFLEF